MQVAINDREGEAASRGRLAVTAAWLADYETSLREFDLALPMHESIGNKRGLAITHTNRALLLLRLGLFREALLSIEQSNAYFETVQKRARLSPIRSTRVSPLYSSEMQQRRRHLHGRRWLRPEKSHSPFLRPRHWRILATPSGALGELEAAIEHMRSRHRNSATDSGSPGFRRRPRGFDACLR